MSASISEVLEMPGGPKRNNLMLFIGGLFLLSGGMNFIVTEAQVRTIVSEEVERKLERIENQNTQLHIRIDALSTQLKNQEEGNN